MPAEPCRLGYFDKNRIERSIEQTMAHGNPVTVEVLYNNRRFRVLVSPALDHEEVLQSRV